MKYYLYKLYEKVNIKLSHLFHNEQFLYVFWGIVVTIFNISIATVCYKYLPIYSDSLRNFVSNLIEWLTAISLSFLVNKFLVFKNFSLKPLILFSQLLSFAMTRILEFILSSLVMFFLVNLLNINYNISKISSTVIFIFFNYICTKFIVFRK